MPRPSNPLQRSLVLVLVLALVGGLALYVVSRGDGEGSSGSTPASARIFESNDVLRRACGLRKRILARVWQGFAPGRSFELILVPQYPNYPGSFEYTGHSGPWDYLQEVPLVLYGSRIESRGIVERPASISDIYSTAGALLDFDLPKRAGSVLDEALKDDVEGAPRLIVTVVWDGVGRNVLELWPDAWPNLKRLEQEGTSYVNATLGSAPSITPATHTTIGTGTFPRRHGIPGIQYRGDDGTVLMAMKDRDPSDIRETTFADEYDLAMGNAPKVGMLGWKAWHIGMLSHGTQMTGGDADDLGIFGYSDGDITGGSFYFTPEYLHEPLGLEKRADAVDRQDGALDGKWMGHDVLDKHDNPSWVYWQQDAIREMLAREAYGKDDVPDLFFTNYKIADIVGHEYTIGSPEMEAVIKAEDEALGDLVDYLDSEVRDYVLMLTADHGHTPPSSVSGGWPVNSGELTRDINARFSSAGGDPVVEYGTAAGFFMDYEAMKESGVTPTEIAEFVNDYTIAENWNKGELPEDFRAAAEENVFSAAMMQDHLPEVMQCAFGSKKLPEDAPD
jgi:predicted AlkP superfamily pyrophosphatase or phosphodiesterase